MAASVSTVPRASLVRTGRAGALLGFALGGFFDGILLHQVLQWHHLLSGLDGRAFRDLRVQILADGLFHALMYALAVGGLVLLWRARDELAAPGAQRRLAGSALVGFGVWHVLDAVLSHWLLGIHRIRMDSEMPLLWDLVWFGVFGVAPVLAGGRLLRPGAGTPRAGRGAAGALALAGATLLAGAVAALPPRDGSPVLVVFRPGTTTGQMFAGFAAAGGGILWADPSGLVWALDLPDRGRADELYGHGALLVSRSGLAVGCLAWTRRAR